MMRPGDADTPPAMTHEGMSSMSETKPTRRAGIATRVDADGRESYRGTAYDAHAKRKLRGPWTDSLAEAKSWRVDAMAAIQTGASSPAATTTTVRAAAGEWLELAEAGHVRNRGGDRYKPSVTRSYRESLTKHVYGPLGQTGIAEITQPMLVRLVERWQLEGLGASVIRNAITALRVVLRLATARGEIPANPVNGLRLPASRGRRDRVADRHEAERLLAALPPFERALYGAAIYAGLRRGELAGLRWSDVKLTERLLRVERSWDFIAEEFVPPKSAAGVRVVPITDRLRELLVEHGLETRASGDDLVFGAFTVRAVAARADAAFKVAGERRITLHECRHTYASLSIAAGVEPKQLQEAMGHASIAITMDRYGHLFPTSVDSFRAKLDEYLD
jgi:integrase